MKECLESEAYFNDGDGLSEREKEAYYQFLNICAGVTYQNTIEEEDD
jgi:hypothetical protein